MAIQLSSTSTSLPPVASPTPRTPPAPAKAEPAAPQDQVSIGQQKTENLTYDKPRALPADLASLLEESDRKVEEFLNFLRPLLEQQGLTMAKVASGEQKLTVDQGTIDAAKAAISEDGEMGVKKVSERILSFAKFATGDDPAKLQKIRDAVELGFSQAKEALGGTLPEISQQTYDTIMTELDRWAKEGIPAGDTVSLAKPEAAST